MLIKRILTEIVYFFIILVVLALLFHSDLLSSPLARFENMRQVGNYLHPFIWSGLIYVPIAIVRLIVAGVKYLKKRKS